MNFKFPPEEQFLLKVFDHQKFLYEEAILLCNNFRIAIDIGAHIGLFSTKMCNDFKTVYSFEPMFYEYLKQNVPEAIVYPCGISSTEKEFKFSVKPTHTGMSRIDENGLHNIKCKSLDSFNFKNVDLIKIDVEGHESFVIDGAYNFFKNNDPIIIIEINDKKITKNILKKLTDVGYETVSKHGVDYILRKNK